MTNDEHTSVLLEAIRDAEDVLSSRDVSMQAAEGAFWMIVKRAKRHPGYKPTPGEAASWLQAYVRR